MPKLVISRVYYIYLGSIIFTLYASILVDQYDLRKNKSMEMN